MGNGGIRMNGWRNRATWLVNLWFNPETKSDIDYLEETLQDEFEDYIKGTHYSGFFSDLIDFTDIDWDELREAMEEREVNA
jgi:hypothetical protein